MIIIIIVKIIMEIVTLVITIVIVTVRKILCLNMYEIGKNRDKDKGNVRGKGIDLKLKKIEIFSIIITATLIDWIF